MRSVRFPALALVLCLPLAACGEGGDAVVPPIPGTEAPPPPSPPGAPTPPRPVAAPPSRPVAAPPSPPLAAAPPPPRPAPRPASAPVAPSPEPPVAAPAPSAAAGLHVDRLVVARSVERREPAGAGPFPADLERVYAFVQARNEGAEEVELAVVFVSPGGQRGAPIALRLPPAPRWRTWATTRHAREAGTWTAVVLAPDGTELARRTFEVVAAEA